MYQGSMVALVTPMRADGSVDEDALARLVEFHVDNGTDAIVSVGTTGESPTLDPEEHINVIARTVDFAAGRLPIIAGAGANSTSEAVYLAQAAMDAGADATLQVTPYYNKPMQEGMYRHFREIAEQVRCPHILYNVPGRTGVDLLPETVERLAAIDNIVGIKEATGDPQRSRDILARCGERMEVYSGEDVSAMEVMLAGGHGDISVTANIAPRLMQEMCALAIAGDRQGAEAVDNRLEPVHAALFCETSPIPVKWALYYAGLIDIGIRLPLTPLSEANQPRLVEALRSADVL